MSDTGPQSGPSACSICRTLGALAEWGEISPDKSVPRPAAADRLTPLEGRRYRCPSCGNQYEHGSWSWSFFNTDFDVEELRRLRPTEYTSESERADAWSRTRLELRGGDAPLREAAALILSQELAGSPDEFDATLLGADDPAVRRVAVRFLRDHAADLRPWLGRLRSLLADPDSAIREASALGLSRALVANPVEFDAALLATGDATVRRAAVGFLGDRPPTDLTPWEGRFRSFLADADATVRRTAGALLASHLLKQGWAEDAAALFERAEGATLAGALQGAAQRVGLGVLLPYVTRAWNDSDDGARWWAVHLLTSALDANHSPSEHRLAAAAWEALVADGRPMPEDVVHKLIGTLSDPEARNAGIRALRAAARSGMAVTPTLDLFSRVVGNRLSTREDVGHLVRKMRDGGMDLEPLVLWLTVVAEVDPVYGLRCLGELHLDRVDLRAAAEWLRELARDAKDAGVRSHAAGLLRAQEAGPLPLDPRRDCRCKSAAFTDPRRIPFLETTGTTVHEGWSEIFCECRRCGRRWQVDEDTSYHSTTYTWRDITPPGRV